MSTTPIRPRRSGPLVVGRAAQGPVSAPAEHRVLLTETLDRVSRLRDVDVPFVPPELASGDAVSLAADQSSFKNQGDRGTCWAFGGVAALEAAYKRKLGLDLDLSEEYTFHLGKAFALNLDAAGAAVVPVENNSTLTGFQGAGDVVQKLAECAIPEESLVPYFASQADLEAILPAIGIGGVAAAVSQEDLDAVEFCEQHVPLIARVNCRYRATEWAFLGASPSTASIEDTIRARHEVVCDVTHVPSGGGHVLLVVGFDRDRQVFLAKNQWGEGRLIEIAYANDPVFRIDTGYYVKDVVDPTFVQNEACWVGNWWMTWQGRTWRLLVRRSEAFGRPGQPTRLGSAYLGGDRRDVNGTLVDGGGTLQMFVAPSNGPTMPGTLTGSRIEARLDFTDIHNAVGQDEQGERVMLSRFATRFAATWERADDGMAWQARHGIDSATYQRTFDELAQHGFRPVSVCGYGEGREARFAAVWHQRSDVAWEAHHDLDAAQYQQTFDGLVARGFRLTDVSGYAVDGAPRFTGIWELRDGPAWQARHEMDFGELQQNLTDLDQAGFVLSRISGYRVGLGVRFAALWEQSDDESWETHFGLSGSQYQAKFDELQAAGRRPTWVDGYTDGGIARYAAVWRTDDRGPWQARHGLDGDTYQRAFDDLAAQGWRPVQVSGYGGGVYPS